MIRYFIILGLFFSTKFFSQALVINEIMSDLYVSWEEYTEYIDKLAVKVHEDGWEFNQVVCIAKGGMRVGDLIARIFDVPLAILSVESYRGDGV